MPPLRFVTGLFAIAFVFTSATRCMAMGGIARVAQMQLLQPFVTFALAAIFLGEPITPQIVLFAAAVVATVAISTRTRARPVPLPPQRDREPPQLAAS